MNRLTSTKLRARAYIRVSHVGKARRDSLVSDSMQLDEARRYCEFTGLKLDVEASKVAADLDVSGFRKPWRDRPGLMSLYEAAKRREFDCVIFFKISRLARNVREALDMIDAFEKEGVAFHFVAERIDSTSAQGRFLRNVLLAAAEMSSEDSSAFLKAACEQRAREGKLQGGGTPCWIRRGPDGYEAIPEQVTAIRRLVELRMAGLGYVKLARQLNLDGHRTVRGKFWTHGMTFKYLQETYVKTMLGSGFYGRGGANPIEIPNAYPTIITQEEADSLLAIQKLYSADYGRKPVGGLDWMVSKRRKEGRRSASSVHLLSGIVFCPACGARMVAACKSGGGNRTSPHSYSCPHYISRSELHRVKGLSSVNALSLEDAVLRVVRSVLSMPPAGPQLEARAVPDRGLASIQKKIDRLLDLHLEGRVSEEDFKRTYDGLLAERELLLRHSQADHSGELHKRAADIISNPQPTREEMRQLVLLMVDRVEAPLTINGVTIRTDRTALRRLARIQLRFPTAAGVGTFLAAIYTPGFGGERKFIVESEDGSYLKNLISPKRNR